MRLGALAIVALLVAVFVTGCGSEGCSDNRSSIPLAGFYSMSTGEKISTNMLQIGGVGAPNDSLLLKAGRNVSEVFLPFRHYEPSAKFQITYKFDAEEAPEVIDIVEFTYDAYPYFVSNDCGAMLRYRITGVNHTENILDSVAVVPLDSVVTNVEQEYIRLYFRTDEAAEEPAK